MYQDKLGCYRVGNLKFYSKLEAIEAMQKTGIHLHWDFNEAVFSCYDWTQEPTDSLPELYRRRAQQLRDQYDYIVLCYSGGADSDNVLRSFVDNDIQIDEVVSMINVEANGDRDAWLNEEIYKTAIPSVYEYQQIQNFKYRVVDLTPIQLDYFSQKTHRHDWIYQMSMAFNPNCVSRGDNWPLQVPEWASIINSGRRFCVVWGSEKPRIKHIDNKFCAVFMDLLDTAVTAKSLAGQQCYTNELFYWTPDLPKIVIKQAHVIKRYLQGDVSQLPHVSLRKSDLAYKEQQDKKYWLSFDGVHELIYPKWQPGRVNCGKSPSPIFTPRDTWFYNLQNEHPIKKVWTMGLDKLWKTLPDYWKNDPDNISKGVKLCQSLYYFIE